MNRLEMKSVLGFIIVHITTASSQAPERAEEHQRSAHRRRRREETAQPYQEMSEVIVRKKML